jgi:hypothetical protein
MLKFTIAPGIEKKLAEKHRVTRAEIGQCFLNRQLPVLLDELEDHQTDPPTTFFIAYTNTGRRLKVVYIQKGPHVVIKTCYEPTEEMVEVYHQLIKMESQR